MIPRKEFYHPSEGLEDSSSIGPALANLRETGVTIPLSGEIMRDNWRKTEMHGGPSCASSEWTGKCVFYENCVEALLPKDLNQVDRGCDLLGVLVFTNIPKYSLVDDLTGEPLPSPLVTIAKRGEVTEMYRRQVWTEKPVEDCFRDTPPSPPPFLSGG